MRQNITPNTAQKLFEAYTDFSGGLNSEISNEKLHDKELPDVPKHGHFFSRFDQAQIRAF
jgi:hypothetical protein